MKKSVWGMLLWFGLVSPVLAGSVNKFLNDIYDGKTVMRNATGPEAYHGQQAGYYTGGSLIARTPAKQVSPAHIALPDIKAGCGGIDIFTGGLSFIKKDEAKKILKAIANGTPGFVTMMGLDALSPMVASNVSKLKDSIDAINQFSINSCQNAALLAGAVLPKVQASKHHICAQVQNAKGTTWDYVSAKYDCANAGVASDTLKHASKDRQAEALFNINLVWDALQKSGITRSDSSFAEWIMSLSGSRIYTEKAIIPLPSLLMSDLSTTMHTLLYGDNDIMVYQCDSTTPCLSPTPVTQLIDQGLVTKVASILAQIASHIKDNTPLSDEENRLINNVSLPVYKMLDIDTMTKEGNGYIGVIDYSEVIAIDWLATEINHALSMLRESLNNPTIPQSDIQPIVANIRAVLLALHQLKSDALSKKHGMHTLYQTMNQLEIYRVNQVASQFASQLNRAKE